MHRAVCILVVFSLVISLEGETLSSCRLVMAVQMNGRIPTGWNRRHLSLGVGVCDHATLFLKVFLNVSSVLELFGYLLLLCDAVTVI